MIRLLLVDDQSLVRQGLKAMLSLEPDLEIVGLADNGEAAIAQVEAGEVNYLLESQSFVNLLGSYRN